MIRLTNLTTVDLAKYLQTNVTKEKILTSENYIYLRELVYRQISRIHYSLSKKQRGDLAHTVASSILMYLNGVYPRGFIVSNWIKYVYNWTFRTTMATYYPDGSEKHEITTIEDELDLNEFINTYYYNNIQPLYYVDQLEVFEGLKNLHTVLEECINDMIKYSKNHSKFNVIYQSVLFSILLDRDIFLYGLNDTDKNYVKILINIINKSLMKYIRNSLSNYDNTIDEYIINLPNYLRYEEYEGEI